MYALVSGHDFYVNCERLFKPSLKGRPVVVLGYNSGSTIARSNEARALGIRMGTPWSRLKHMEYDNGLVVLSANYGLYGNMSSRFMPLAASLAREQEIYSIDECFIGLHGVPDTNERACSLSARIKQYTGIPCSIGIGQTRTLAKLANYIAQAAERRPDKYPIDLAKVCDLSALPASDLDQALAITSVRAVWGINQKLTEQLRQANVHTVLDLARMAPSAVRRRFGVTLERTVFELQGISRFTPKTVPARRREITCTHTFQKPISHLEPLIKVVRHFTRLAAERLRKQDSLTCHMHVFACTSPFGPGPVSSRSVTTSLDYPTANAEEMERAAIRSMRHIYAYRNDFTNAGVAMLDLVPGGEEARYTKDAEWAAIRDARLSPQYTTRWKDVPVAQV